MNHPGYAVANKSTCCKVDITSFLGIKYDMKPFPFWLIARFPLLTVRCVIYSHPLQDRLHISIIRTMWLWLAENN